MYRQLPPVVFVKIVLVLVLAHGLVGCDSTPSRLPLTPSPPPQAGPQPPATGIQLTGYVSDTAYRPLADVTLEIVDGPESGKSTTSDVTGRFLFTGMFDETTLVRATKVGHLAATGAMTPSCATCNPSRRWINFYLAVSAPPVRIAGEYSLTFVADSSCALPDDMRTRTYSASVVPWSSPDAPDNTMFAVTVSGAPFLAHYDGFSIGVAGDHVAIAFGGHGPTVVEQIAPNTYLAFDGWGEASITTPDVSTIATSVEGSIDYCERQTSMGANYDCHPLQGTVLARCASTNHRLILTRR